MRKVRVALISGFICLICLTNVHSQTYSLTRTGSVSTSIGTATVSCTGNHYTTDNTRWSRSWSATNPVMSTYVSSNMTVKDNEHMSTRATISMTGYDYSYDTATRTYAFRFTGTKVVADN